MTTTQDFTGRSVVITGAGSGIGRATAHAFADAGADVLAIGRTAERLTETAKGRPTIRTLAADITDPQAHREIVATALREFDRIDVLVNNAAVIGAAKLGEIDPDRAQRIFDTNLNAPIFLTQEALPELEKRGGVVINISTAILHGLRGWAGNSIYGASKTALEFLTRTWAVELAPRGVRVAGVAPGVIRTPVAVNNGATPEQSEAFRKVAEGFTPLGRIGEPEEVAWWIVNIARPEAGFATGFVLAVDGGAGINGPTT